MGIGIDLPLLLFFIINFIILFALLSFLLYKPVLKKLDERSARIKEGMEHAERMKEESARAEEMVKAQLEVSRKEGQSIVAQATQVGERLKEETRQEAKHESEVLIARARLEIQKEREDAIEQLRAEFVDVALAAAEKVIGQSLDREAHQRLIEQTLRESTTPEAN